MKKSRSTVTQTDAAGQEGGPASQQRSPAEPAPAAGKGAQAPLPGALLVPIDKVERDPDQPRRDWRHGEGYDRLNELTQSIKEFGVLQPLVVRRVDERYVVIAGGRRLVAARRAGLREVPVIVRDEEGARVRVLQLTENLQRQQLAALDEARAYQELMEIQGLTTGAVATRLHVSAQTVRDKLRLLRDQVLADAVERRHISATVAREINKLPDDVAEDLRRRIQAGEKFQVADIAEIRAQLAAAGVVNPRWNPRPSAIAQRSAAPPAEAEGESRKAGVAPAGAAASRLRPSASREPAAGPILRLQATPPSTVGGSHEPSPLGTGQQPRSVDTHHVEPPAPATWTADEPRSAPHARLNRAEAVGDTGPSLAHILRRLGEAYPVYEKALLYGVARGWSCAGLLQRSHQERDATGCDATGATTVAPDEQP